MSDLLRDALVNELSNTLAEWDRLTDRAERNQWVDKGRMNWFRVKITDLCSRLDAITKQKGINK